MQEQKVKFKESDAVSCSGQVVGLCSLLLKYKSWQATEQSLYPMAFYLQSETKQQHFSHGVMRLKSVTDIGHATHGGGFPACSGTEVEEECAALSIYPPPEESNYELWGEYNILCIVISFYSAHQISTGLRYIFFCLLKQMTTTVMQWLGTLLSSYTSRTHIFISSCVLGRGKGNQACQLKLLLSSKGISQKHSNGRGRVYFDSVCGTVLQGGEGKEAGRKGGQVIATIGRQRLMNASVELLFLCSPGLKPWYGDTHTRRLFPLESS